MSAKKYIDRDAALFELRTGFFPQSMEFTQAVSIAKGIIERAPGVDADETVREIFEEIGKILRRFDEIAERDKSEYGELIVGDITSHIAELKKKYVGKDINAPTSAEEK